LSFTSQAKEAALPNLSKDQAERAVSIFLGHLLKIYRQPPLPFSKANIRALVAKGQAVLEYSKESLLSELAAAAVDTILGQALVSVTELYPEVPVLTWTKYLTLQRKKGVLCACLLVLAELVLDQGEDSHIGPAVTQSDFPHSLQAEIPSAPIESAQLKVLNDLAEGNLPQIPLFLQPSQSHPVIVAGERACAERQQLEVFSRAQVLVLPATNHHEASEVLSSTAHLEKSRVL